VIDIVCSENLFIPGWNAQWHLLTKPYVNNLYDVTFNNLVFDLDETTISR